MQVFEVPARLVLGVYLVLDNLLPYLISSGDAGVAHGAHIGGFLAGLAAAWLMDRRAIGARPRGVRRRAPRSRCGRQPDWAARIAGGRSTQGRMEEAAVEYFEVPAHASAGVLTPEHSLALARWLLEHGHHDAALVVARRHLRDFPRGPGLAEAQALAGRGAARDASSRRRRTSTSWRAGRRPRSGHGGGGAPRDRGHRGAAEAADRPSARAAGLDVTRRSGKCVRCQRGGTMRRTSCSGGLLACGAVAGGLRQARAPTPPPPVAVQPSRTGKERVTGPRRHHGERGRARRSTSGADGDAEARRRRAHPLPRQRRGEEPGAGAEGRPGEHRRTTSRSRCSCTSRGSAKPA